MNMQQLLILLTLLYVSHASPLLPSDVVKSGPDNNSSTSYYEGYPQRSELEKLSLYLLGHLQGSRALSTINLAFWNQHFDSEEEACQAVDQYLQPRRDEADKSSDCEATYKCDFNKYRFPATIIDVDCESALGYCRTTQNNWPVRGSCTGDQYDLTTLQFIRNHAPLAPISMREVTSTDESETSGDGDQARPEDIPGRWVFQSSVRNKNCLCL